ncbi:MAG: inositol monophosphatase family protein [Burkholderiaceae bacterium]|jgi:myo-inositol-1(or 4)-monophosphatase
MHPMLNVAIKAARAAGKIINRASLDIDLVRIGNKGPNDFVTETDQAAETTIIDILRQAYPTHAILAEESGASGESDYQWIIDPLDGTANFIHNYPHYAVSIALAHRGVLSQAVIFDPVRNDLFTASRGEGAFLNNRRIRVSKRTKLRECLIGISYPAKPDVSMQTIAAEFVTITRATAGIRRTGSAVLDLAYIASGRLDGYLSFGLKPWDLAAGALLVQEAGGLVTDFTGESDYLEAGDLVAANAKILPLLLGVVNEPDDSRPA